jgi:hypothetical protein
MSQLSDTQLSDTQAQRPKDELPAWSFWGSITAAIAAQACCGLPWLLLAMGASTTWVSYLSLLKPWRPLFVFATLGFLLAGFFQLMRTRRAGYVCKVKSAKS